MARKTLKKAESILNYIFETNKRLAAQGKPALSIELIGDPGVGKTTMCKHAAEKNGLDFVKLSISQIDDLSDFIGFPIRSFEVKKDGVTEWVLENEVMMRTKDGWAMTGGKRTDVCPPAWLAGRTKPMVLLIDDWTRAQPRFQQAMMEFIECQTYASNKLPEGSTVLLTSNPDDGDNMVNSIDSAMRTRFGSIEVGFDVKEWAEWAAYNDIDDRCISFFLLNPEIYNQNAEVGNVEEKKVNPRSLTKFFMSLEGIKNFESPESQERIADLADAFVSPYVSGIFSQFITERLDTLLTPEQILDGETEVVAKELKESMTRDGSFMASIANVIAVRLENFIKKHAKSKTIKAEWVESLGRLLKVKDLFPKDITFDIAKTVFAASKTDFMSWVTDSELRAIVTMR